MYKTKHKEELWENMTQFTKNLRNGDYISGFDLAEEEVMLDEIPSKDDVPGAIDSIAFSNKIRVMETIKEECEEGISVEDVEVEEIMSADDFSTYANADTNTEKSKGCNLSTKEHFKNFRAHLDFENYPVDTPEPEDNYFRVIKPEGNEANNELKTNVDVTSAKNELSIEKEAENMREVDIFDLTNRRAFQRMRRPYLSTYEQVQIETMFRSLKSEVFLCSCEARMYAYTPAMGAWTFEHIGVPVLVLEKGILTNTIWLFLAERGTGFAIWKDLINFNTMYTRESSNVHTMALSWNHSFKIGFKFDEESAAGNFFIHMKLLTSYIENIGVSLPKHVKPKLPRKKKTDLPLKLTISWPCCFTHITTLVLRDRLIYRSLQNLVDADNTPVSPSRRPNSTTSL